MITPSEELAALRERVKCDELTFALRDELLALCERLVRDAERYRWLRENKEGRGHTSVDGDYYSCAEELDAALDAAISAKQPDKQKERT